MQTTPNSDVSRKVQLRVKASSLAKQLRRVCLDTPPQPVRVLFTAVGMSVWTHDLSKTMHLFLTDAPLEDYKVKEPCVLLVNPKEFSDVLSTKYREAQVQIKTEANQPITITDKSLNSTTIYPADEDDCAMVPDRWQMPESSSKPGWKTIPQQGNLPGNAICTTRVEINRPELVKAVVDMQVASAPYCEFIFGGFSSVTSGHWTSKTTRSQSVLTCTVETAEKRKDSTQKIGLTDAILTRILSTASGDEFVIHKHSKTPFAIFDCGDMTAVVAETQKGA